MTAEDYIHHLKLTHHPEGGYFRENYRATENISSDALPSRFTGSRSMSTSIYFLLKGGDYSAFHRIKSDEGWHFYAGEPLIIHIINKNGKYDLMTLGANIEHGQTFQFVVPAESWFAAEPAGGSSFALVGCTVAPGFDFSDFEMGDRIRLLADYPAYSDLIVRLCR